MDNMNKVFPNLAEMPIPVVVLIICGIGAIIGLFNGFVIAYLKRNTIHCYNGDNDHHLRYQLTLL